MNRKLHTLIATLSLIGTVGVATAADEGLLFESVHDYTDHAQIAAGDLKDGTLPALVEEGTVDYSDTAYEQVELAVFEPVEEQAYPDGFAPAD